MGYDWVFGHVACTLLQRQAPGQACSTLTRVMWALKFDPQIGGGRVSGIRQQGRLHQSAAWATQVQAPKVALAGSTTMALKRLAGRARAA